MIRDVSGDCLGSISGCFTLEGKRDEWRRPPSRSSPSASRRGVRRRRGFERGKVSPFDKDFRSSENEDS